ncbi:MAG: SDR family oxidoreductase [Chloroflexi bacterium]|nr:SDR family oxidoreductase [Chloroflexota bacterium]
MKVIVITGSTRGIGLGLARSFMDLGCAVVISGRSEKHVQQITKALGDQYSPEGSFGLACDVTNPDDLGALWDGALEHYGVIDIWINNAGVSGPQSPVWDYAPQDVERIIQTNILGTIYGSNIAVSGMLSQGHGAIYNMEGFGSKGRMRMGMTAYGTTKAAVTYFTKSLAKELKSEPLIVGTLQPGMVITDLVMDHFRENPDEIERVRKIFNIIADRVENVTPWLAKKMLNNQKSGVAFVWTPGWKLLLRFLSAPFSKRDVFK